jgi:hypothetical protein
MSNNASHNTPQEILDFIKRLERRISVLERTGRVVNVTNSAGAITFYGQDGTTPLFQVGDQALGDRGVTINHDDGTRAIVVRRQFIGDTFQTLQLWSRTGSLVGGENYLADGVRAPFVPITLIPVTSPSEATTSSGTFSAAYTAEFVRMNATVRLIFLARCTDGTTSGEVQLYDTNTGFALGGFLGAPVSPVAIPVGTTSNTEFDTGSTYIPADFEAVAKLEIRFRRTAGAGSVIIRPLFMTQGPA